ncbi:MAG: hypothetical protein WD969_15825 [Paracoccaceae bacterium]
MGFLNIVRRIHLRRELSIREIAQLTAMSAEFGTAATVIFRL